MLDEKCKQKFKMLPCQVTNVFRLNTKMKIGNKIQNLNNEFILLSKIVTFKQSIKMSKY